MSIVRTVERLFLSACLASVFGTASATVEWYPGQNIAGSANQGIRLGVGRGITRSVDQEGVAGSAGAIAGSAGTGILGSIASIFGSAGWLAVVVSVVGVAGTVGIVAATQEEERTLLSP